MTDGTLTQGGLYVEPKHSGFGIASFVIALVQGLINGTVIMIAGLLSVEKPEEEMEVEFAIVGLAIFAGLFINLVGLGLGIAGIAQENRKKAFAILGLVFNICAILLIALIMLIGMTAAEEF